MGETVRPGLAHLVGALEAELDRAWARLLHESDVAEGTPDEQALSWLVVAGGLPTTAQAQAGKALINKLTPEECDRVTSLAEVEELARTR